MTDEQLCDFLSSESRLWFSAVSHEQLFAMWEHKQELPDLNARQRRAVQIIRAGIFPVIVQLVALKELEDIVGLLRSHAEVVKLLYEESK